MKLRSKFIVFIILITAVVSGVATFLVTRHIERTALTRAEQMTARYIKAKVAERLALSNFSDTDFYRQRETFSTFLNLIRTPEIIKIKVFNARFDIVYSTNEQDIGKKTDSVNYRNTLTKNAVVALIKPPETEAANVDMLGYQQVMEVYVPIEFQGQAAGVIEAYFRLDEVNKAIAETSRSVIGIIIGFSLIIIVATYVLLTFLVVRPLLGIITAVDGIAAGQPGAEIPETGGSDEIGQLTAQLKKVLDLSSREKKMF
ncbi:MAG: hypothetical protein A2010_06695 [Nitrospirae bacterium GWD2_57_9]|nr:MAG: hypothetical protein A2010_06695 [Nitrospirae bacterium GWD2_57_9]OGW45051.1 MAG: hypothetical protein A2078_10485 [Nitrospirae bacterium GWC2_57_9]